MKKILSLLCAALVLSFTVDANAASKKLGGSADGGFSESGFTKKTTRNTTDKEKKSTCTTDADCQSDEYCNKKAGDGGAVATCVKLCRNNVASETGKKCAETRNGKLVYADGYSSNKSSTPKCYPNVESRSHTSYCGCTDDSCAQAYKCEKNVLGKIHKCMPCPAGETCGCKDGKKSNGNGYCVECISDSDCPGDQMCQINGNEASCVEPKEDDGCVTQCGYGYVYDRQGGKTGKNGKQEKVCTKYPLECGYACTNGWRIRYLVNNTEYTCQEAAQCDDKDYNVNASANPHPDYSGCPSGNDLKDARCISNCGEGFKYDRMGGKNKGKEVVCTKYPKSCGWNCTTGWNITYLVDGTNYTCQQAYQCDRPSKIPTVKFRKESDSYTPMKSSNYSSANINHQACKAGAGESEDAACVTACGEEGYKFTSMGYKNGGQEKVCTKYPQDCGYACTSGWDINYLVDGTHTCQKAIQCVEKNKASAQATHNYVNAGNNPNPNFSGCKAKDDNAMCAEICGNTGYKYDRPGAKKGKNGKQEKVCTYYPRSCGYNCTTGWNIRYLVNDTEYTCQQAVQCDMGASYNVGAGNNPNPDFDGCN